MPVQAVPPQFALHPFGVFTTFVAVDGRVLGWSDHVARLSRDARTVWGHRVDPAHLARLVRGHLAGASGAVSVRVTLYPQVLHLGRPGDAQGCRVLVSSAPAAGPPGPSDFSVRTVEHARALPDVKSTGLFEQLRLRREAQLAGFDDALFRRGRQVLEGATWSVVCWRGSEVVVAGGPVLAGITAAHLIGVGRSLGRRGETRRLRFGDLHRADLVLAVNANAPTRPLMRVDGRALRVDRDLLNRVAAAYEALPREPV